MSELVHITATGQELVDRAVELSEHRAQSYLTQARTDEISRQMGHIFFELHCREQELLDIQAKEPHDARASIKAG